MLSDDIYIILVEPESPGNIGAVARAMKTCGLKKLILVNPCETDHPETRMFAHRSLDIVKNALRCSSLGKALHDMQLTIGTTMRKRKQAHPFFTPAEITERIFDLPDGNKAAIVFGREQNGLSNEELELCQIRSTIPIATSNPALNLSQAVMIYCHYLFMYNGGIKKKYRYESATHIEIEKLYKHLDEALTRAGFIPRDSMNAFLTRFKRLIGRSNPEQRDIFLLHKIIQVLEEKKK